MSLVQRQDRLLYLATYFLLNLAEDVSIQRKLARKDVVRDLQFKWRLSIRTVSPGNRMALATSSVDNHVAL